MPTLSAQFESVVWWWVRNQIGQELRERYEVPEELPPELLPLVRKLDDGILPAGVSSQNNVDLFGGLKSQR